MRKTQGPSFLKQTRTYLNTWAFYLGFFAALPLNVHATHPHSSETQVGAFKHYAYARQVQRSYEKKHQSARIEKHGHYWAVLVSSSRRVQHRHVTHKQHHQDGWCVEDGRSSWVDLEHGAACRHPTQKLQQLSIYDNNRRFRYLASISAGPAWGSGGTTQNIWVEPSVLKAYDPNTKQQLFGYGEVFAGLDFPINTRLNSQLGLVVGFSNNAPQSGDIWDDADNEFNNYSYRYDLQHTFVGLKGKVLLKNTYYVVPWLSADIGLGINSAKNYSNTPKIFQAIPSPNFINNTDLTFSYRVGAGAQYNLTERAQIGIGYEFADWGNSALGPITGIQSADAISMNHYYVNELMVNLTYYW